MEVTNSIGNGSNGSHYTITDSTVNYSNNGSHGLSAGDLIIKNSTVTAENNGYYGAYSSRNFLVDSTSKLIVTKNSAKGDFAGLKLTGGVTDGKVEAGAIVTITDNYCSGLSNNGKCTFAEGANLTIMNNNNDKGTTSNGGGIYNSGASANLTLPSNAVIYNNHADTAGDDIFNNTTATITFGKVGSDWVLDGDPDCEHMINGWYDDSANNRWAVHPEDDTDSVLDEDTMHAVVFDEFENGLATVTSLTALKAAHGEEFKDKFSYPGLDKQVGDDDEPMNDEDVDAAAGQTVNFKLTSNVPDDLRNYLKPEPVDPPVIEGEPEGTPAPGVPADENRGSYTLTFHDVMDTEHKMLVDPENFVVTVGGETENGTELPVINLTEMNLSEDVYNITQNPADGCTFEITLDLAKLYELGKAENIDVDAYIDNAAPITVTYQATLSEDAVSGQFENKAWVTAPEDWKTSEDVVYVNTYAIDIYKYKQGESETGLSGAEFVLKKGDETVREGITSGENGHVVVGGLDKGEYTLTETKAPEGYVCSETPLDIKIPTDAGTGFVVNVSFANSLIPHTGGMGTTLFSIVGGALIVMAGTIFVISRRKRRA